MATKSRFGKELDRADGVGQTSQCLTGHASKAINDRYTRAELETLRKAVDSVPAL